MKVAIKAYGLSARSQQYVTLEVPEGTKIIEAILKATKEKGLVLNLPDSSSEGVFPYFVVVNDRIVNPKEELKGNEEKQITIRPFAGGG
ncbi:hypothetical protein [Candidatus Hecatella orcuttiae]|jgi:ribosomal protein S12 methylthiotransferase accessory factor YcaO|uniref:hypothetical protein n=1 Tax=Candidatus Hecatella orcuttiae TaxID=1935119 RepID=UPI002867BF4F|nr:hypothetical protein [Candidatus Hecatella orcuttiae]